MDIFIYREMGSLHENWSCPEGAGPQQLLVSAFSDAFSSTYGVNTGADYDCFYVFPVPWQNKQAQPADVTFTGPGEFVQNEVVTFTIQVQHTPRGPETLTP